MTALHHKTMAELCSELADGSISSRQATQACLDREVATRSLGAYLHIDAEGALEAADAADGRRAKNQTLGPLDGVPIGLKDIFMTQDMPTTCGSRMLEGYMAPYDATVVRRLREGGAVILGKLTMDEFAM